MSTSSPWRRSDRFDPAALPLADRHYNRRKVGSPQFVPPGRCLVLLTEDRSALWVTSWPFPQYVRHAWPGAWVNSLFRREGGPHLASDLITWAVAHTRAEWPAAPDLGIVTFVDAGKVRRKRDPGRCYRKAGWVHVGYTQGGLWAFQQREQPFEGLRHQVSEPMPAPQPVSGAQMTLFGGEAA